MYLGRQQLGTYLDVFLQVKDASRAPLMPDGVPSIKVLKGITVVHNGLMPILDKTNRIGLFHSIIFLGGVFSEGTFSVRMGYSVSGVPFIESRSFEVVPAGNALGQVLGMYYLHSPQADFVVYSVESGSILKGKNPRLS